MPCGHYFGHHYGHAPFPGHAYPHCGCYPAPGYGPAAQETWAGRGFGYGPFARWAPPGPPPWARPFGPTAPPTLSDEDIRKTVESYLRADPRIPPEARIEVEVSKGVVTLTGSVPDKWVKQAASEIVLPIPGVVDVQNNLQVAWMRRIEL